MKQERTEKRRLRQEIKVKKKVFKKEAFSAELPGLKLSMALIFFHQVLVLAGFC
jgi:hypothetical protein